MPEKKRRTRTGCLTCRARRVKCDEEVPKCRRCVAANLDCAGYEARRVIANPQSQSGVSRRNSSQARSEASPPVNQPSIIPSLVDKDSSGTPDLTALIEEDFSGSPSFSAADVGRPISYNSGSQKPLFSLPSSPRPDQRPCAGAKHVLGYHQALFRTIPLFFTPKDLRFWRDELSQEAWGCEYLFLTLVALGNLHRAARLMASGDMRDENNGLDIKITAVHVYTQALEQLANNLVEAKQTPTLLVAVLCLMAYFEALSGNIPAFIGRVQAAHYYFKTLISAANGRASNSQPRLTSLRACLRSLGQTCYISLPLQRLHSTSERYMDSSMSTYDNEHHETSTSLSVLQSLMDLVCADKQIEELVWSPLAPHARQTPSTVIHGFEERLKAWRNRHIHLIPDLDSDAALNTLLIYKWEKYSMPPIAYQSTTRCSSLAAAHYNFYLARVKWAMLLLGENIEQNQLSADFYFYEALRHAVSHVPSVPRGDETEDAYVPCEALKVGLLPVLHVTALCSPQPAWLVWIKELCEQIVQEGVLKGHTFATNLDCLHMFETYKQGDLVPTLERYPKPSNRIICQLIPETDGRNFTSYFAAPKPGSDPQSEGLAAYQVIGHAQWRCLFGERPCAPEIEVYEGNLETFSSEWLHCTRPALEWMLWSKQVEFRMDRALQDHINGTRLLLAADELARWGCIDPN